MPYLSRYALAALFLSIALPARAGDVRQIAPDIRCIRTIEPSTPLLAGIPTGKLSPHVLLERCGGLWLSLGLRGGTPHMVSLQSRFIPKYRARNKPFAIPDARVTIDNGDVREAWLTRPTRQHSRAITGDAIEATGLAVTLPAGREIVYELTDGSVFEDRMARIVDLDGDKRSEIVTVHSKPGHGSSIAVFGVRDENIVPIAETPPVPDWLEPVAAADFDGNGHIELAYVENPDSKEGRLRIVRLETDGGSARLEPVADLAGFAPHAAGSGDLLQATTFDWNGDKHPDLILPGPDRTHLRVVTLAEGKLSVIDEMPIGGIIDSPLVAADLNEDGRGEALLVTKDARLLSFSPTK